MGFALEQVGTETARLQLIKNSLIWFGVLQPNAVTDEDNNVPSRFVLNQNYPNPFSKGAAGNSTTNIKYSIPRSEFVTLKVYNSLGQQVAVLKNRFQRAGIYRVHFDASKLASGVYIYTLRAGNFSASKKMILLK